MRRSSRRPSTRRRPLLKLTVIVLGLACSVVGVTPAATVFERQRRAQTVADSDATVPRTARREPVEAAQPEEESRHSGRRKPKPVPVSVMNGAGVQGLAATKSTLLRRRGFKVAGTGTAPATRSESVVWFTNGKARDARRVARALRIESEERNDQQVQALGRKAAIVVVLGTDAAASGSG